MSNNKETMSFTFTSNENVQFREMASGEILVTVETAPMPERFYESLDSLTEEMGLERRERSILADDFYEAIQDKLLMKMFLNARK